MEATIWGWGLGLRVPDRLVPKFQGMEEHRRLTAFSGLLKNLRPLNARFKLGCVPGPESAADT